MLVGKGEDTGPYAVSLCSCRGLNNTQNGYSPEKLSVSTKRDQNWQLYEFFEQNTPPEWTQLLIPLAYKYVDHLIYWTRKMKREFKIIICGGALKRDSNLYM